MISPPYRMELWRHIWEKLWEESSSSHCVHEPVKPEHLLNTKLHFLLEEAQRKGMQSGRDAWSRSYHHHLPKPNLWRHVFGVLFINVSIIILSNPQQEGDGGCIRQPELYLSLWTGDLFHLRAEAQECFCSHASMWRIQRDLKEDPCSLIMFQSPMQ